MDAVGRDETTRQAFYQSWMAARRHPCALVYEANSVSPYAATLEAVVFVHNRDGEPLSQENLALVCDRTDGMPLSCRLVPGSVPDVVTLEVAVRMLRALGLTDSEFARDRGFYSNSNAREMPRNGHHFTLGVLLGCRQSTALLAKYRAALNSPKRSICHEGRSVRHVREVWKLDMGWDKHGKRRAARIGEAHVFFDLRRHADRTANLDERVSAIEGVAARVPSAPVPSSTQGTSGSSVTPSDGTRSPFSPTIASATGPRSSSTRSRTRTGSTASAPGNRPSPKGASSWPSLPSCCVPNWRTACAPPGCSRRPPWRSSSPRLARFAPSACPTAPASCARSASASASGAQPSDSRCP